MPARLHVTLRERVVGEAGAPTDTGHKVLGAVLGAVRELDVATGAWLHEPRAHRGFAVTPLCRSRSGAWEFRVGVLADPLVEGFCVALDRVDVLRLGHSSFDLERIDAYAVSYASLLDQATRATRWELRFRTPTTFRMPSANGIRRTDPLPAPVNVFGSLARRWAHYADGCPLPEETVTVITDHLALSRYRLETKRHVTKPPSHYEIGFIGEASYTAVGADSIASAGLAGVSALTAFATIAGVGDHTAMGMGWTELRTPAPRGRPASG